MHGIWFIATADSDNPTTINLHSTGADGVGAFDLAGRCIPGTGQIILKKVYSGGVAKLDWARVMTHWESLVLVDEATMVARFGCGRPAGLAVIE